MQILITTLAEYQTVFWLKVGLELRRLGHEPHFLSFDDRSTEMLLAAGLPCRSATARPTDLDASDASIDAALATYGMSDLNYWLGHERFAFGLSDHILLRQKLLWALKTADEACAELLARGPTVMVQELGGFLSVIGSFFAARRHGIDNWFAEPSFFRGRLFYLRNSFSATSVAAADTGPVLREVRSYLQSTVSSGAIVVPIKDRHQYTTARKKIVNLRNARRLLQKLADKYLHGKTQEFGYIGSHVRTHARMLWSSHRLRKHYTPLESCHRFVYYPLHVPGDMALTLRTPHLLDQLALVDFICRAVPHTHLVTIKEHPAMVGAIQAERVLDLLRRHDNLRLLPPTTNNYLVLRAADSVVSVNSKSGAEAALLGKPVIVLGDAFYRDSPLVQRIDRIQDLPQAIAASLSPQAADAPPDMIERYFTAVWKRSVPGELYVPDDANIQNFTAGLIQALSSPQA
jgi:hypothetical protein